MRPACGSPAGVIEGGKWFLKTTFLPQTPFVKTITYLIYIK
ncbi:MAG: hypothetical protein ACJAYJ_005164 [Saprospiraceae bacterium]|jgi:hypothetical protein